MLLRLSRASLAALLLVVMLPPAASGGSECPLVISGSTTLTGDLTCVDAPYAIIFQAHSATGAVLDLNGHTVRGVNSTYGVYSETNHQIEIRNGTIEGFATGIFLRSVNFSTVEDLTLVNGTGISWQGGQAPTIRNNVIDAVGNGIYLFASPRSVITGNKIMNARFGLNLSQGGFSTLSQNEVTNATYGVNLSTSGRNTVSQNVIEGAAGSGIRLIRRSHDNTLSQNTITGFGNGIEIGQSDEATIDRNEIRKASRDGVRISAAMWTTLSQNTVTRNEFHGLEAFNAQGLVLEQNTFSRNGLDGIRVWPGSTLVTLLRNTADFNGGLGINSIEGTTDLGGNEAKHNGDTAQCLPVYLSCHQP